MIDPHDAAVPMPFGVTSPIPVMTTLSMEARSECEIGGARGQPAAGLARPAGRTVGTKPPTVARRAEKAETSRARQSQARDGRSRCRLLLGVLLDVIDGVLHRPDFLGVLVRN